MSAKGFRKQFCVHGHDTFICGRYDSSRNPGTGACKLCAVDRAKANWKNMTPEAKKEHLRLANEWNNEHPEKRRKEKWKRRYGITPDQYDELLKAQDGKCAICKRTEDEAKVLHRNKTFGVDHDHNCCQNDKTCGKCIRGLLCTQCNSLLGMAKDNIEILKLAIFYLNKFHGK